MFVNVCTKIFYIEKQNIHEGFIAKVDISIKALLFLLYIE